MSYCQTRPRGLLRRNNVAKRRPVSRLLLECLEDRCVPAAGFTQINLASDVPGMAHVTNPNLVNPWGLVHTPTGPFWFAENGSGVSDILDGRGQAVPLVVTIPSADAPTGGGSTGTVVNYSSGFRISANGVTRPGVFLFDTTDGTISGWNPLVDPTHAILAVDNSASGAVYLGLAFATNSAGQSFLYAADFANGRIDVFDQDFKQITRPGAFQDPNLPDEFVPYNIQAIGNQLFVAYAPNEDYPANVDGGPGFIDVYDTNGDLVRRFASQGALSYPWGMAMAPASYGPFGGALLVGNNGDGRISAFDPASGAFLGQLEDDNGKPLEFSNLWGIEFGNGAAGGNADTLFFAAGPDFGEHGLFGAIQSPNNRNADTAGSGIFDANAPGEPADYPLPPMNGPVLPSSGTNQTSTSSVLLPVSESSLALIPTLVTISEPSSMRLETPLSPGAVVPVSFNTGPSATAAPSYGTSNALPLKDTSTSEDQTNTVALNTFLDVNPSQISPVQNPETQPRITSPNENVASSSPELRREVNTEGTPVNPLVEAHQIQALLKQGLETTQLPIDRAPETNLELAPAPDVIEIQQPGSWKTVIINVICVVNVVLAWRYILWRQGKLARAGVGQSGTSRVVKTSPSKLESRLELAATHSRR